MDFSSLIHSERTFQALVIKETSEHSWCQIIRYFRFLRLSFTAIKSILQYHKKYCFFFFLSTIFGRKYSRGLLRLVSRRTRKRRNQRQQRSKGTKHCEQLLDKCREIKGRQAQPQRDWTGHVTDNNRCIDSGCQCYLFMATIDVITSE